MHKLTFILLVVGGLNWLLEAFDYGLGGWGLPESVVTVIYVLIGLSAIYEVVTHKNLCKNCSAGASA